MLYHWDKLPNCLRWGVQGNMDQGEMDWLVSHPGGMVSGGGFYMADDAQSSSNYGPCATVARIPVGTPMYDVSIADRMFQASSNQNIKVQLGRVVPFIHLYSTSPRWYVTHSHVILQDLQSGGPADSNDNVHKNMNLRMMTYNYFTAILYSDLDSNWMAGLGNSPRANTLRDGLGYLKSLIALAHYYDGFSLLRAAIVAPDNPWSVFDPLHFEAFRKALEKYHIMIARVDKIGLASQVSYYNLLFINFYLDSFIYISFNLCYIYIIYLYLF